MLLFVVYFITNHVQRRLAYSVTVNVLSLKYWSTKRKNLINLYALLCDIVFLSDELLLT